MNSNLRVTFGLLGLLSATAHAYFPVLLHNPGVSPHSFAFGAGNGQQVGGTNQLGGHALLWHGTSASAAILTPSGYSQSRAYAAAGGRQVGVGYSPGVDQFHALLWSGSANNYVSLHPASGFRDTYAQGIGGNQQIGGGTNPKGELDKALLWHGSAESVVVLHPEGYGISDGYATDGVQQVGSATLGIFRRAILWSGAAESAIDLTPAGAIRATARGVASGQQVGTVQFATHTAAAIWHGSAESFVDLTPEGWTSAVVNGTNGTYQVGSVGGIITYASAWSGTAESWLNLHALLPPEWGATRSVASGIDELGNIVGYFDNIDGVRAVMWVVPEPGTIAALAAGVGLLLARRRRT